MNYINNYYKQSYNPQPARPHTGGNRTGISTTTAQQRPSNTQARKNYGGSIESSKRAQQTDKKADWNNKYPQQKMRVGLILVKQEINGKPTINKNNPSLNKVAPGSIKIHDLGHNKLHENDKKHQETLDKQLSSNKQETHSNYQIKPQIQERTQKNIANEYRKLEDQRLNNKKVIASMQEQISKLNKQLNDLVRQKEIIRDEINSLSKQRQTISIQIQKCKQQLSRYSNYQNQPKGTQRIVQPKNENIYWNKKKQETQGINRNNVYIQKLQKEVLSLKKELQKSNFVKQTLKKPQNQYGVSFSRESRQKQSEELLKSYLQLQQKLRKGNQQLQELKYKNAQLQNKLKQQQINKLALLKQIRRLQEEFENKITNNLSLNNNQWKAKYENMSEQLQKMKNDNQDLKLRMTSNYYCRKISENQKKLQENKKKQQDQINSILKKGQQEKNKLKYQLEQYKKQKEKRPFSQGQTQQYTQNVQQLKRQIQKLNKQNIKLSEAQKINTYNARISQYMIKIRKLQQDVEKQKKNNLQLNKQFTQKIRATENLKQNDQFKQKQISILEKQKENLRAQIKECKQKQKELKQQNEYSNKQLGQLQNKNINLQRELKSLEERNSKIANERNSMLVNLQKNKSISIENDTKKKQIQQLQTKNISLQIELSTARKDIKILQQKNKLLAEKNSPVKEKNAQLLAQNVSSKARVNQALEKCRKKQEQLKSDKNQIDKLLAQKNKELQAFKIQFKTKQQMVKKYLKQIQQRQKQINALTLKLGIFESEKDIKNKLKSQQQQKLKQENTKLYNQVWNLGDSLKLREIENKKQSEQLSKLKQQNSKEVNQFSIQIRNKQKVIQDLQKNNAEQLNNINRMTSQIQTIKNEKKRQIDLLQEQVNNKECTIESLKSQIKSKQFVQKTRPLSEITTIHDKKYKLLQEENKKLQRRFESKQSFLAQLEKSSRILQENYTQIRQNKKKLQYQKQKLQEQNRKLQKELKTLNPKGQRLQEDYRNLNVRYQQLNKLYNQLSQKHGNCLVKKETEVKPKSTSSYIEEISQLKNEYKSQQRIIQQQQQELKVQRQFNNTLDKKYKNLAEQLARQKQKKNQLQARDNRLSNNREILQLKRKNQDLSNELSQLKSIYLENQKKIKLTQQNSKQIQTKNRQISALKQKVYELTNQLQRLQNSYMEPKQQKKGSNSKNLQQAQLVPNPESYYRHLFHGQVLREFDQHKVFIKQCIEDFLKTNIVDTRLIYRYDPLSKENIHKYIDEKPHLVVVIKLINGYFLAGYAQGVFKTRCPSDKSGLIMSLTNKKCYHLVQRNKRAIAYDDFFVIFGNSEIRIKSQEKKIFSNFGLSNSYYRHNGDGVSCFLGGGKSQRQMQVVGYEFHQLIFEQ